ncbi:MAG: lysophospholipid acyltransferase family protein [Candidatus Eisenbacteria bacterium]
MFGQSTGSRSAGKGGERLLYYGYILARIAGAMLPLRISYRIAERVADIWYALSPRTRENLKYNLNLVPGTKGDEAAITKTSRAIMRNFARMVTEFLYLPRLKAVDLERLVDVESFTRLKAMLRSGSAIFVTAHMGNWELGAAMVAMMGIDLNVVVYDHPDPRIARLFRERREAKGLKVMSVKEAARHMRSLTEHSSVGIVADRDFTGQGTEVDLFGVKATVPDGYAAHAVTHGIPVIAGFCIRKDDGKYHLVLEEPLFIPGRSDVTAAEVVTRFTRLLEKCVEEHTEQWYFFQRVGEKGKPFA